MTIAILHLSDIHFASTTDAVTGRVRNISTAICPNLRDATSLVVLLSGDIAQAGLSEEYLIAEAFLSELIGDIGKQSDVSISVVLAPGNHDCDFSGDQDVRHAIIEAVKKKGVPIPEGYISTGVKVQENFFSFREKNEKGTTALLNNALWKSHLLKVEGKRIIFDMLNASWMSTKHEQQGGLIFPFEQFSSQKPSDADLRIVTMHHPLNWYNQNNYLKFRGFIHHLADLVVSCP